MLEYVKRYQDILRDTKRREDIYEKWVGEGITLYRIKLYRRIYRDIEIKGIRVDIIKR